MHVFICYASSSVFSQHSHVSSVVSVVTGHESFISYHVQDKTNENKNVAIPKLFELSN